MLQVGVEGVGEQVRLDVPPQSLYEAVLGFPFDLEQADGPVRGSSRQTPPVVVELSVVLHREMVSYS